MRKLITGIFVILYFCQMGFAQIFKNITQLGPFNARQRSTALHIDYTNPKKWYLGTDGGGLWISKDAGFTWKKQSPMNTQGGLIKVIIQDKDNPKHLFYLANTGHFGIYKSTDGGQTFTLFTNSDIVGSWYSMKHLYISQKTLYLQSSQGIYQIDPQGNIQQLTTQASGDYYGLTVMPKNAHENYVLASTTNKIYRKEGDKEIEEVLSETNGEKIYLAHCQDKPNIVYAITSVNKRVKHLYKSENYGVKGSWKIAYEFKETETWRPWFLFDPFLGLYVHPQNPNKVMIVSTDLHLTTDGGKSWKKKKSSFIGISYGDMWPGAITINPLNGKWITGHDHGLFEGTEKELFSSDLNAYETLPTTILDKTKGVAAFTGYEGCFLDNHSNNVAITAQDRGTWLLRDGKEIFIGGGDTKNMAVSDRYIYHMNKHPPTLNVYTHEGKRAHTGYNVNTRNFSDGNQLATDKKGHVYYGNDITEDLDGYRGYALSRSTDEGKTFTDVYVASKPITTVMVHPQSQHVYFLEGYKQIKKLNPVTKEVTTLFDVGKVDENVFFYSIELNPTNENIAYGINHLKLYEIRLAQQTIKLLKNSNDNTVFNCLAVKNDSILFLGSSLGIFYTANRGNTWQKATDFPTVRIIDLDLRPSDGKLFAFTYGMGAWVMEIKSLQHITFDQLPVKTYNDTPFTLTATTTSGLPITYSSSNPAVATISGNQVIITGAGKTTINASQAGNDNFAPAQAVAQELTVQNQVTSLPTLSAKQWLLFPNPAGDILTLRAKGYPARQLVNIQAYDGQGKEVLKLSQKLNQEGQLQVSLKNLPPGKYLFKIEANGQTRVHHIVKQ